MMLKLQSNLKLNQEPNTEFQQWLNSSAEKSSFADHMLDAAHSVAADGHALEGLSELSNNSTELAVAMDKFLVELSILKAVVDEARKGIDKVFQESRA